MDMKKRKAFSKKTQEEELRRADNKCRDCGTKLNIQNGLYHFDHKNGKAWDNSQKNCKVLCLDCHWKKTKKDLKKRNMDGAGFLAWDTRRKNMILLNKNKTMQFLKDLKTDQSLKQLFYISMYKIVLKKFKKGNKEIMKDILDEFFEDKYVQKHFQLDEK